MTSVPQITDAEWEVMEAVWAGGPLAAGEVVERVAPGQKWKPRTIKTLLNRLVKKGAVSVEVDGRRHTYRARITRDSVVKRETRSFLSRVFNGDAAPAIVHFLEQGRLSPEQIKELKETLARELER
jgi:BlaI family transcriptional regulator, penicillinase repressor